MYKAVLVAFLIVAACPSMAGAQDTTLTVMTFNIRRGGTVNDIPLEQTAEIIRQSGASIVGIQEKDTMDRRGPAFSRNNAQALADLLGWDIANQRISVPGAENDVAILSRLPIDGMLGRQLCAGLTVSGRKIAFCNLHLAPAPYQPYQLNGIRYLDGKLLSTQIEAIAAAEAARGAAIDTLISELASFETDRTVLIVGDFNEPSHLDWTDAAARARLHPIKVAFPQSTKLAGAGFIDAFRAIHPDEVARPGFTWTPLTAESDPKDHHDRIDFIYVRGATAASVRVIGEKSERADQVFTPWPSDHRAVVADIRF